MSLTTVNQADLILPTLANIALGKLIDGLKFVSNTTRWADPIAGQNANQWYVPQVGGGSRKERLPGAPVIFEDRTSARIEIPTKQHYDAFTVDESFESSKAIQYFEPFLETAILNILEGIETQAMLAIAQQSGISAIGSNGVAVTRTQLKGARKAFVNNKIPRARLMALVSAETNEDLMDIAEFTRADASGEIASRVNLEGVVRKAAGFVIEESPYVASLVASSHRNLLFDPGSIMHIFPAQNTALRPGQVKAEASREGFRLYILRENTFGYNGGEAYTVSCNFGIKAVRPEGVIHWDGK